MQEIQRIKGITHWKTILFKQKIVKANYERAFKKYKHTCYFF
jgi:hypothetical protein